MQIHSTAIVHPKASLADDVEVGPFCLIGEHVTIGKGTRLLSHVSVDGWLVVSRRGYPLASIGGTPTLPDIRGNRPRSSSAMTISFAVCAVNRATASTRRWEDHHRFQEYLDGLCARRP